VRLVTGFLEFMRALAAAREGLHDPCRVTVVTRRAAFDVASARAAALWGAVRALGCELDSGIDLRLADIGQQEDLTTPRWLASHDVRERELAIRDGRLHAPRLVTVVTPEARVPAAAAGRYQLQVTAPGQISGLSLRSVPSAANALGDREVEIYVAATALN
jgi:polyene macrolide polyketide synthase